MSRDHRISNFESLICLEICRNHNHGDDDDEGGDWVGRRVMESGGSLAQRLSSGNSGTVFVDSVESREVRDDDDDEDDDEECDEDDYGDYGEMNRFDEDSRSE